MTEHAPGSAIRLDDDARAPTGSVAFTVALGGGGRSGQYAAVVAPLAAGQAAGSLRVRFRASSDRPCRLSMQLRQPAGRNGWRWVRSVYLDAALRDIVVNLDDLRATEPGSPARPDLARVDAMLFTVDTVNLAPGDRRSIRLAGVAFERGDRR